MIFAPVFEPRWKKELLGNGVKRRNRQRSLCLSEVMTILVSFHQACYRNFKQFYQNHVCVHWKSAFPGAPSYQRFIDWLPETLIPLCVYLKGRFAQCSGIGFVDSTCLKVCHNRRINQHKTFKKLAARGKTSVGWFFGNKVAFGRQ